jgi:hypothetical protein
MTLVQDGLLAQAGGPGGCVSLLKVDSVRARFFPDVRIIRGTCILEHGDTFSANVAVDTRGTLFLLDSPSAFRFLLRRHPAVGIDSASMVDYARIGLVYSGFVRSDAQLVDDVTEITDSALLAVGRKRNEIVPSGIQRFKHGVEVVWVTTGSRSGYRTFGVSVNTADGEIVVVQRPGE